MDPAEAIAELKELSTQIESVTLARRKGDVIASSLPGSAPAAIATAAAELVESADELRADLGRDALAQVQAATSEGSAFVVVDAGRMAIATTGTDPTVGLVFYDLKTLLRQTADSPGPDEAPVPPEDAPSDGEEAS
jgi:predicted regulator of Ras-like GTPase activity (Roadblock/LC7/MglB family)